MLTTKKYNQKIISIVTPCFNEVDNITELVNRIEAVMRNLPYDYEHIFIDNNSNDGTSELIKKIAFKNKKIKLIINTRNFGHIRSPYYGLLQSSGDASIMLPSDLQDPPELIYEFIKKWESGFKITLAIKTDSNEFFVMKKIRNWYYKFISKISEVQLIPNALGSGIFDKSVINILKKIDDPNPYFRGLLCEIGFNIGFVEYNQDKRKSGITKNNFYTLFDLVMLAVTKHSKIPLRIMTIGGFLVSFFSLLVAFYFIIVKIINWDTYQLGTAPILVGIFFFGAVQTFFLGFLGEYLMSIHTQVRNLPLIIEAERINFD